MPTIWHPAKVATPEVVVRGLVVQVTVPEPVVTVSVTGADAVVTEIAQRIDLLELDVRNVLSYYSMLRTKPAGKYNVQVCTNISCMLRGGFELLDHCKHTLGIGHKQTTPDGLFSIEEVECIGACCWAPAVQVNYDFHDDLTPAKMDTVFEMYRSGQGKDVK